MFQRDAAAVDEEEEVRMVRGQSHCAGPFCPRPNSLGKQTHKGPQPLWKVIPLHKNCPFGRHQSPAKKSSPSRAGSQQSSPFTPKPSPLALRGRG